MVKFEKVLRKKQPDAVLVVGDVNSTIACGLVAVQMGIKLIHVEAGLRSFDRTMPEEINRLLTDAISDILFCSEKSGVDNLRNEGIPEDRIHLVGNVMIDTLLSNRDKAERSSVLSDLELQDRHYAAVTLHRPSNVDDPAVLSRLVGVLRHISADMPVAFPVHPRTRKNLEESGEDMGTDVRLVDPLGYLDFLKLMTHSRLVLTDSGGIQEETTILGVPCLTLREQTERPVTVEMGTNRVVGTSPEKILSAYEEAISSPAGNARKPPLWDGKASERIVKAIAGM